jgi:hypothetical protein
VAVLADKIVVADTVNFASVILQQYDASGAPVGAPIPLASEDGEDLAIGASGTSALVLWAGTASIQARGFSAGAAVGAAPYLFAKTGLVHDLSASVVASDDDLFAVAFSGNDTGYSYQTAFGRGTTTGRVGDPSNLFSGHAARHVVALARTPPGYALLVGVDEGPVPYALLVLLDVGGRPTTAGLKLVGTGDGSGLVVNGSEIGVLAHRTETHGQSVLVAAEFRPFDLNGAPLGPWVCFDPPAAMGDVGGALAADGAGYAALYRTKDGATSLVRFDHLGTGSL